MFCVEGAGGEDKVFVLCHVFTSLLTHVWGRENGGVCVTWCEGYSDGCGADLRWQLAVDHHPEARRVQRALAHQLRSLEAPQITQIDDPNGGLWSNLWPSWIFSSKNWSIDQQGRFFMYHVRVQGRYCVLGWPLSKMAPGCPEIFHDLDSKTTKPSSSGVTYL